MSKVAPGLTTTRWFACGFSAVLNAYAEALERAVLWTPSVPC